MNDEPSEAVARLQGILIRLNAKVAPIFRDMPDEEFNLFISAVDKGELCVGGDSGCFHIKDDPEGQVVWDCTPA